jgi:hypothetical protein
MKQGADSESKMIGLRLRGLAFLIFSFLPPFFEYFMKISHPKQQGQLEHSECHSSWK